MAGTTLVRDLFWRVSVLLQDSARQFTRWTEEELVGWCNDGQLAIVTMLPMATAQTVALRLKTGTKQSIDVVQATDIKYPDGSSPSSPQYGVQFIELVRNMGADGVTPGPVINISDRNDLDATDANWHAATGQQVQNYVFSTTTPKQFFVTPGATTSPQVWVDATIAFAPSRLIYSVGAFAHDSTDTTKISLDDQYVEPLVNYICARAHMKDTKFAMPSKAASFEQLFVGWLNAKVQTVTGVNPNLSRLPLAASPLSQAQ